MKYLLDGTQAKSLDRYTIETFGMQSLILMERAAYEVAACIKGMPQSERRVFIMVGTGNNGADGLAVARMLCQAGYQVCVLIVGSEQKATSEWKYQKSLIDKMPVRCCIADENTQIPSDCDWYVDALFGIGLRREVAGLYKKMIEQFMSAAKKQGNHLVVAVDISSGISADTGAVLGTAVKADITVSFGYAKTGQMLYPGAAYTGELRVVDIGFASQVLSCIGETVKVLEKPDAKAMLPIRDPGGNKGSFGNVLVAAGAAGMAGAACFAAEGAYRSGAGLVRVFTDLVNHLVLQIRIPEAVLIRYENELLPACAIKAAKVILVGPGLSTGRWAEQILKRVLSERGRIPAVIDADGLNLLAEKELPELDENVVLTPHLGEMSRLLRISISEIREMGLVQAARLLHERTGAVVVCKDARTVVYGGAGMMYLNETGNDGMATGGSGDVLAGVIAGLIAQGVCARDAAVLGVYIHGFAGDLAMKMMGRNGMLATDILRAIPSAMREIEGYS